MYNLFHVLPRTSHGPLYRNTIINNRLYLLLLSKYYTTLTLLSSNKMSVRFLTVYTLFFLIDLLQVLCGHSI